MNDLRRPRRTLRASRRPARRARDAARPSEGPARGFLIAAGLVSALALLAGVSVGPRAGAELLRIARGQPFQVRTVSVVGARRLAADRVARAAAVPGGLPLLDVDVEAVAARVAALPEVAAARALRLPPDRLVVGVTERVARGVAAAGPGGSPHLVCDEGVAFAPAAGREALGLPRLGSAGGARLGEADPGLARAAHVAAQAAAAGFAVARVEVDAHEASLHLAGLPARVRLGPAPHAAALARLVQLVARRPDLVGAATLIDVRFADRAVLRSDDAPEGAQQEATARGFASPSGEPAVG
jgi:cell division protein FtsQ